MVRTVLIEKTGRTGHVGGARGDIRTPTSEAKTTWFVHNFQWSGHTDMEAEIGARGGAPRGAYRGRGEKTPFAWRRANIFVQMMEPSVKKIAKRGKGLQKLKQIILKTPWQRISTYLHSLKIHMTILLAAAKYLIKNDLSPLIQHPKKKVFCIFQEPWGAWLSRIFCAKKNFFKKCFSKKNTSDVCTEGKMRIKTSANVPPQP